MSLFSGESSYEEPEYSIINTPSRLTKIMDNTLWGEMSFSDYKRMYWVVCKTSREDTKKMRGVELERFS
jgi:hypothetical protein